jgi:hypothetical protein
MLGVIVTKKNDKFWHTNCYTKVAAQINAKKRVSLSYHPGVAAPGFFIEDSRYRIPLQIPVNALHSYFTFILIYGTSTQSGEIGEGSRKWLHNPHKLYHGETECHIFTKTFPYGWSSALQVY